MIDSLPPNMASKLLEVNGCWEWQAYRNPAGYGILMVDRKPRRAHRLTYELLVGPIPAGLEIDHLCRNRACANPAHLEPVTRLENVRRGMAPAASAERNRAKTHCVRGHLFDEANTRITPKGYRDCRACRKIYKALYRQGLRMRGGDK